MRFDPRLGSSVGIAVRELEPVLDLYESGLSLGPFEISEIDAETAGFGSTAARRPAPARLRVASAPLGECEMELIEVIGGRPPHAEFLEEEGEGMNHFNLDKLSAEAYLDTLSTLYQRGIEPFWGLPFGSFCYVESESIGGVTFEVMVGSGHAGKKGHHHLGLVVRDTADTIDFYTKTFGLGPFRTGEFPMPRAYYRDQRIEATFRASFCDLGPTSLRLYQVLEGETPLGDRLRERGEGMHHLCLHVEDLDETLAELAGEGVASTWHCPERRTTFLDTTGIGGMVIALAETERSAA